MTLDNAVQIWTLCIPEIFPDVHEHPFFNTLSPFEQKYLKESESEEYRTQYFFSHSLLRIKLGHFFGMPAHEVPLVFGDRTRPSFKGTVQGKNIYVSLSHASTAVSVAFGFYPVGVDIEIYREHNNFESLFRGAFSREEVREMESLCGAYDRYVRFHQLWTLREALYKMAALTPARMSEEVVFRIGENEEIFFEMDKGDSKNWHFKLYHPLPASYLAVAVGAVPDDCQIAIKQELENIEEVLKPR